MKIIGLQVENIKRLKAVSVKPTGKTVVISGRNAQGKTSLIDSIEYALAGKDSVCEVPIRQGQEKARIVCDLGDIVVERTFAATSDESYLRVRGKDGTPVKSPQRLLDTLCEHRAFDPLSFVRLKPAEQAETLRRLVGLDFTALDARRKECYDSRTLADRELIAAKARLAALPFHADAPAQDTSAAEAQRALDDARKHNDIARTLGAQMETYRRQDASCAGDVARYEREIAELERKLIAAKRERDDCAKTREGIRRSITLGQIAIDSHKWADEQGPAKALDDIAAVNRKVRENAAHAQQNALAQEKQAEADRLTHEIEAIDAEKAGQLEWAAFPLPGLSFDGDRVLLDKMPFSQASQAQQLQAAVAIGLALNPKIRVILIRDASLLDDDSMRLMGELAEKHDAQIWLEVVNSDNPAAVIIEDGEIKTTPAKAGAQ